MAHAASSGKNVLHSKQIQVDVIINDNKSCTLEKYDISSKVVQFIQDVSNATDLNIDLKTYEIRYISLTASKSTMFLSLYLYM